MTDKSMEYLRVNLLDANLLRKSQNSVDDYERRLLDIARFSAAFYLNYPLFVINLNDTYHSYPSIFDWPKTSEGHCLEFSAYQHDIADRQQIASCIPQEYTTKLPVQIFCQLGYIDEAIYYVDHFNDVRASVLIRLIDEEGVNSIGRLAFVAFIEPLFVTISHISTTEGVLDCRQSFKTAICSLVELDSVLETKLLPTLEAHLAAKMESSFAELALMVEENVPLPRPPPYVLQQTDTFDSSKETIIFLQIHCLLEVYLMALSETNRLEMELGILLSELICISRGVCVTNDQYDTVLSQLLEYCSINDLPIIEKDALLSSVFARVLVVVLLIVHRDHFSLLERKNLSNIGSSAIPYKALLPDDSSNLPPLGRWLSVAQPADISELLLFSRIIQEKFGSPNDFPPLTDENIPFWRAACYSQETKFPKEQTDYPSLEWNPSYFADEYLRHKMNYIATKWTAPQNIGRQNLLQMRLKLIPEDIAKMPNKTRGNNSEQVNFQLESPISRSSTQSSEEYSYDSLPHPHGTSTNFLNGMGKKKNIPNYSYPAKGNKQNPPHSASTTSNSESPSRSHQLALFPADDKLGDDHFSIDSLKSPSRPVMERLDLLLTPTPRKESKMKDWYTYSWMKLYPLSNQLQAVKDRGLPIPLLTLPTDSKVGNRPQPESSRSAHGAMSLAELNSPLTSVRGRSNSASNLNLLLDTSPKPKSHLPVPAESNLKDALSSARLRRNVLRGAGTSLESGAAGDDMPFFQHVQVMSENRLRSILTHF